MRTKRITPDDVLSAVLTVTGTNYKDIADKGRHPSVVAARTVYCALSKKYTIASGPERAAAMGKPNHSTVFTAEKRFDRLVDEDADAYRATNGRVVKYKEIAQVAEELLGVRDPQAVPA